MAPRERIAQLRGHLAAPYFPLRKTSANATTVQQPGVTYTIKEHSPKKSIATITINNPRKLNIVNSAILNDLIETCNAISQDPNLRAVVLTGGPTIPGKAPSFIGGADITEMHRLNSSEEAREFITRIHKACEALRAVPVPVIARVHGFSLGAGLEIMAACDLRIATKETIFGMPEVKVGIPSVIEAALLPGLIGMGRTRRLLYLAENIDAVEAERWGLVELIVSGEIELDALVGDWIGRLCEMGSKAVRSQKRLMLRWENCPVDESIQAGVEAFAEAYEDGGQDPKKFMGKFIGRNK